jgi:hypothetical protein
MEFIDQIDWIGRAAAGDHIEDDRLPPQGDAAMDNDNTRLANQAAHVNSRRGCPEYLAARERRHPRHSLNSCALLDKQHEASRSRAHS